ncbi:MAG: hypothetical protein JW820_07540 [Spirochaetales bacterium]|nr:hypothetical protein [Spirochaetales bacterium]
MRKAAAVILVILLVVPLVLGALWLFSVSTWILDRGFYLQLVSDERLYEALLQEADRGEPMLREPPRIPGFDGVPPEALSRALRAVLTPSYLRSQALALVNDTFDALEGRAGNLELHLDLAPLKAQLLGQDGRRFAQHLASALPVCAPDVDPAAPEALPYRCRPAGTSVESAAETIYRRLPELLAEVPDLYPLAAEQIPSGLGPEGELWFGLAGSVRLVWISIILAVVAGGFWVGTAFVGGSSRREVVQWLGWPLVPPAILMLVSGLSIRAVRLWRWLPRELQRALGGEHWRNLALSEALAAVLDRALDVVSRGFLISGGLTIGIAAGLIVWSSFIPPEPRMD